jgi:hypothetical protein
VAKEEPFGGKIEDEAAPVEGEEAAAPPAEPKEEEKPVCVCVCERERERERERETGGI